MHCNDDGSTASQPTHDRLPPGGLRMHAVGLVAQADPQYDVDTVFGILGIHTLEYYRGLAAPPSSVWGRVAPMRKAPLGGNPGAAPVASS